MFYSWAVTTNGAIIYMNGQAKPRLDTASGTLLPLLAEGVALATWVFLMVLFLKLIEYQDKWPFKVFVPHSKLQERPSARERPRLRPRPQKALFLSVLTCGGRRPASTQRDDRAVSWTRSYSETEIPVSLSALSDNLGVPGIVVVTVYTTIEAE